jgi:hypothetical protein
MHTCLFCGITFPQTFNYTRHLRYYGTKPESQRKEHPAMGTTEFDELKRLLNMRDMPEKEEDDEKEEEAKRKRKSERNHRHHSKKVSETQAAVAKHINLAV